MNETALRPEVPSGPDLFMGMDGGGTKTAAVVIDASGRRVAEGRGGPSNSFHNPPEVLERSVRDAVDAVLKDLNGCIRRVAYTINGEGGLGYLSQRLPGAVHCPVHEPSVGLAAAGVPDDVAAVVVIAGTGSSTHLYVPGQGWRSVGGWGSLLGDEGSAYDIARQGIRRALRALDGRAGDTALTEHLLAYFHLERRAGAGSAVEIAVQSRDHIAGFCVEVGAAASAGDEAAVEIMRQAAESLAFDAAFIARKALQANASFPVVMHGGAFQAGCVITEPFARALRREFPRAQVMLPDVSPAEGAARMALMSYRKETGVG